MGIDLVKIDLVKIDLVKGSHSLFNRAFSSHDTILYRNEVAILEYNLCSMSLAVYAISIIKKNTGKHLYSCFNLCSSGILSVQYISEGL